MSGSRLQLARAAKWIALGLLLTLQARPSAAALTAAQWQADLQYLSTQLPSVDPNLFVHMSREEFANAVDDLNQRIPQLSGPAITAGLMRIVVMAGDAHTAISLPYGQLPITMRWLTGGLYVTAAGAPYARALGARVIRIGNTPVDDAYQAVGAVVSHENDQWLRELSPMYLATPEILYGLGIVPSVDSTSYLLEDAAGERFSLDVVRGGSTTMDLPDPAQGFTPLWLRHQTRNYWYEHLPGAGLVYVAYNACRDDPALPFATFVQQLTDFVQANGVKGLVIDLRNNYGGNSEVIAPLYRLIDSFPDPVTAVSVLIGRGTFSSGMFNAIVLADRYGLTLIGEPTGGKPNGYGNVSYFRLPNSSLTVNYSTKQIVQRPYDYSDSVAPDIPVAISPADYFARHDPVLMAALTRPARYRAPQGGGAAPATVSSASFGGPVSPGSLASVFGDFTGVPPASALSIPIATTLAGVQVKVNGVAAPLLAVGPGQINFQVPGATAPGAAQIEIAAPGRDPTSGAMQVVSSSPGIFLRDFVSVDRPGIVLRQDGQFTDATVRARRNEAIILFGTGAGELTAPVADGAAAPFAPLAETIRKPRVFVGPEEAYVEFSGLAPGFVGLWQINARVPDAASIAGQMPVVVTAPDGYASNAVTLWFE